MINCFNIIKVTHAIRAASGQIYMRVNVSQNSGNLVCNHDIIFPSDTLLRLTFHEIIRHEGKPGIVIFAYNTGDTDLYPVFHLRDELVPKVKEVFLHGGGRPVRVSLRGWRLMANTTVNISFNAIPKSQRPQIEVKYITSTSGKNKQTNKRTNERMNKTKRNETKQNKTLRTWKSLYEIYPILPGVC